MLRAILLITSILVAAPALAQSPNSAPAANPTVPVAPPEAGTTPPEKIAPSNSDMSGKLSQQKGVIAPPNVDPGMKVSPPHTNSGTMPVIPPPGSPGGNKSVTPK